MGKLSASLGILAGLLAVAFLVLRTPDTDPAAMRARYGGPDSRFTEAANGLAADERARPLRCDLFQPPGYQESLF